MPRRWPTFPVMGLEAWLKQQAEAINCTPADGQTAKGSRNGSESMCLESESGSAVDTAAKSQAPDAFG